MHSGAIRRPAFHHAADEHAVGVVDGECGRELGRELLGLDPQPAAGDLAVSDDLLEHVARERNRDGETDALRAAALGENRAVDPDQVSARVDQCAAGVAGVDRRIGLDEVFEPVDSQLIATERADDSVGD